MSATVDLTPAPGGRMNRTTTGLTRYTRLQVAPGLLTRFDLGPQGLTIVSLFSRPVALEDAIGWLEASGHDFLPSIAVVNALIEAGALIELAG